LEEVLLYRDGYRNFILGVQILLSIKLKALLKTKKMHRNFVG
jgi:hypothetical protein